MSFKEFLAIRGKLSYYLLLPIAIPVFAVLTYVYANQAIAMFTGFGVICCTLALFGIKFEYKLFRSVKHPTFKIYQELMKNANKIQVGSRAAVYSTKKGTIVYSREFPGSLENEEFDYFSLVEQEIIEYPFRQAVILHQRLTDDKEITQEHIENRKSIESIL